MSVTEEDHAGDVAGQVPAAGGPEQIEAELIRVAGLSGRQVARAREIQKRQGISFLEAAIATRAISRASLMSALSKQFSYPIIHAEGGSAVFSRELVAGHEPFGPAAEELRSIRSSLVSAAVSKGVRAFAMMGSRPGMGSTYFAGNLAIAFAQMSVATLLVDANLRNPRIAEMFGAERKREGLTETLLHGKIDQPPIINDVLPGLSVLTSGAIPPNPQELLCSEEFVALTANFNRDFGIVIYDTPSALEYADAYVVASRIGAAVIVARKNSAKFKDVAAMTHKLRGMDCNIVGSVFNQG
jgi:protein-tyrosine kinase